MLLSCGSQCHTEPLSWVTLLRSQGNVSHRSWPMDDLDTKGHCVWMPWGLRVTLLPSSEMDAALKLGRIWKERKDKLISLSDLSYPRECYRFFYTQASFPGGDKHAFPCFFLCSNLELSSCSQISTVFTTSHRAAMEYFAMLSNLYYSEIWTHVNLDLTCMKHDTTLLHKQLDECRIPEWWFLSNFSTKF